MKSRSRWAASETSSKPQWRSECRRHRACPPSAMYRGLWRAHSCVPRSEEHTSELQSLRHFVCRLLLEKKKMGCNFEAAHKRREESRRGTHERGRHAGLPKYHI